MKRRIVIWGMVMVPFISCTGQHGLYSEMESCLTTSGFEYDYTMRLDLLYLVIDLENSLIDLGLIRQDDFASYYQAFIRISQGKLDCDSLMDTVNELSPRSFLLLIPSNFTAPLRCFEDISRRYHKDKSDQVLFNEYMVYINIIVDGNITVESYSELISVLTELEEPIGAVYKVPPVMLLYSLLESKCSK